MESDEEVVREPFENDDEDSVSQGHSSNQSPNHEIDVDEEIPISSSHHEKKESATNQMTSIGSNKRKSNISKQISRDGYSSLSEDEDDEDLSTFDEDANFAKSFGIELKGVNSKKREKSESVYERLMKSSHIEPSSSMSHKSSSMSNLAINIQRPLIKTSVTSDCIYHKGTFYQKGDIVALCDQNNGLLYFAQLTGFLQDQYCEKSASVNWLVPIRPTSREFFDPSAYRIGLEDVQLRKLDCMTFIRHCPHDYYLRKIYPPFAEATQSVSMTQDQQQDQSLARARVNKDQAYIWTTMKPCSVPSIETKY